MALYKCCIIIIIIIMVEVTLVRGGEESMEDPSLEVALRRRGRVSFIPSDFRSGETCVATRFLLGGRICYTSVELIAAHFAYLRLVVQR